MAHDGTAFTLDKRQLHKAVAEILASHLTGEAREQFLADAGAITAKSYPAPSRDRMRAYLRSNIVR